MALVSGFAAYHWYIPVAFESFSTDNLLVCAKSMANEGEHTITVVLLWYRAFRTAIIEANNNMEWGQSSANNY
jgi:hypothetical protein